jgi:cysteine desulfurase family protein (TIGR01976 family)
MLDVEALRSCFPALAHTVAGQTVVHLDGPGGTQVPRPVIDAVSWGLEHAASNVGGPFAASARSDEVVSRARMAAADFVGGGPSEIVFGPNMTTLTFGFSRALSAVWRPGDRVVVSGLDHDANVTPWVRAAADRGAEVVFAGIRPETVTLDLDHLESLVDHRTRLVAVTACSNAFGSLVDVQRVAEAAHAVGAQVYVDAVHAAPHRRLDVAEMGADFLVCSAYKFYGPHVGVLWGKGEALAAVSAYKVRPAPDAPPGRFETGTQAFPLLAGLEAAVDHLAGLGTGETRRARLDDAFDLIARHEQAVGEAFLAALPAGVRVWGLPTMDGRVPTFAVSIDGVSPQAAATRLGERGIFTWPGHYYAVEPMRRLGVLDGGLLRIGFVSTSTVGEVERLVAALADLAT